MQFSFVVLADRLVRIEEAAAAEDAAVPAVHAVAGDPESALVDRLAVVVQRSHVEVIDRAHALAARTHAAETVESRLLGLRLAGAAFDGDRTAGRHGWDIERYAFGEPMCGFPSRLKTIRSIALASVAVPTVERGFEPIRS